MSLDITLLNTPKKHVSVGVDDHVRLMQLVNGTNFLLKRLNNYYEDVEFQYTELDTLIRELNLLLGRCQNEERFHLFLAALVELAEQAKDEQQPLVATLISNS